jgi:hypothetical protein
VELRAREEGGGRLGLCVERPVERDAHAGLDLGAGGGGDAGVGQAVERAELVGGAVQTPCREGWVAGAEGQGVKVRDAVGVECDSWRGTRHGGGGLLQTSSSHGAI